MLTQYIGNIGRVEAGQILVIVGKTTDAASRLDLNLKSGKNEEDNIVLQLSVRFNNNIIIRNSRQNGAWDVEEHVENVYDSTKNKSLNPVVPGDIFKFYILIGDQKFHIAVNNQPFCTFDYRLPLECVRTVELNHDLQFVSQIDHRSVFPFPHPPVQFDDTRNIFSNDVPRPFKSGHLIVITGIPYGNPKGHFIIKMTEAASKRQALHFSARFSENVVVRNTMNENNGFASEERHGGFPFRLDQQFKLAIALTARDFRFAVDGAFFAAFTYRSENVLEKLNGFKISTTNGLYMEITSVDHLELDTSDCYGFESYSYPDVEIY